MSRVNICFHGIGRPQRLLEPGEEIYWVGEDQFLAVLDVVAGRDDVTLSFDDGNHSDVEVALPALRERGLKAAFFVLAGRLDSDGSLSSAEVRTLADAGMVVGTHGWDHRSWRGMDSPTQRRELEEARSAIAHASGTPVVEAACPLGRYDRALLGRMRALGYTRVLTSDRRPAREGAWLQPRFSVRSTDSADTVRTTMLSRPKPLHLLKDEAKGIVKRLR